MEKIYLCFNDLIIRVWVARDFESRAKGLSGVSKLSKNEGMLFVFDDSDEYGIWMKGMLFPIDVIWIDENWKIVFFVENLSPCAKDGSNCKTVYPTKPARYILEVAAGTAKYLL